MTRINRRTFLTLSAAAVVAPALPGGLTPGEPLAPLAPPAAEIFLLECHIAGTSHVPMEEIAPHLEIGERLSLVREPANAYDALAILVLDARGAKLGYVPRNRNEVLARLLDAGKPVYARLEWMHWFGGWLKVTMRIHMPG